MNEVRRKLLKARTGLLLEHPFFGSLCLRMEPKEDRQCATAWTDGRTLGYNPDYIAGLEDSQVQGLMAHTVMHPACQHHTRRKGREANLWNIACDHAINWLLLDAGLTLPPRYLDNPVYHGLSSDEIYAELKAHGGEEDRPALSDGQGESDGETDWDGVAADGSEGENFGENSESGAGEAGGDGRVDEGSSGEDEAASAGEQSGDPGGSGEVRDAQTSQEGGSTAESGSDEQWELALAQAAQQARDMGDLPGNLERLIQDVLNPKIDWQEILERFIFDRARDDYSWTPPNKRFLHLDVILPSLSQRQLPEVVLVIDTSGSVSESEMDQFAAELSGILEAYDTTVRVLYCDSQVVGHDLFDRNDLPLILSPQGGGGTDYRPPFFWLEQEGIDPACLVYLTDLECIHFPEQDPEFPVLWARIGGSGTVPPFGEILEIL
ncbi:DUF2201 family putative metallopeptidase [Pseudodesulfovibrio piezophilus]|uniref:Metal-dependent peptidase n=1 Tax=Pseudodesulfovibrio piezophilus (strain DSM 21447 / JCM 15486 / C1TLV30) TaxID=1322246 RepID=M1WY65_PSEP2|nr:VWA-like domain-containing protein [Pseudodesulfovibrio piezophilus]CCH50163.1 conserved protein of unknown function [Pseudodesulfovibrio piezophilus C1TLV30]